MRKILIAIIILNAFCLNAQYLNKKIIDIQAYSDSIIKNDSLLIVFHEDGVKLSEDKTSIIGGFSRVSYYQRLSNSEFDLGELLKVDYIGGDGQTDIRKTFVFKEQKLCYYSENIFENRKNNSFSLICFLENNHVLKYNVSKKRKIKNIKKYMNDIIKNKEWR